MGRFFFDFGPGCLKNIVGNKVPVAEVNESAVPLGLCPDIDTLQAAALDRPLRAQAGVRHQGDGGCDAKDGAWHVESFTCLPVGDGYEVEVTEFDYKDQGGICYDKNGVTVRHWPRSHTMDGASGYRLDWNGLSFVWTGDGKPDQLTAKYAKVADVFVSEMVVDIPALWA